jgi:hypothetical protein
LCVYLYGGRKRERERWLPGSVTILFVQAELERLHQSGLATTTATVEERGEIKQQQPTAPRSPHAKIVTENERLRKELKKVRLT